MRNARSRVSIAALLTLASLVPACGGGGAPSNPDAGSGDAGLADAAVPGDADALDLGGGADAGDAGEPDAARTCEFGDTQPCYTGPEETEGVGPCVAGTWSCLPDGSGWGECQGEVIPALETCNGADDDCNSVMDDLPDLDGDGWTPCDGDCCDTSGECSAPTLANPGGLDLPTEPGATPFDDDCDGTTDEGEAPCDSELALDDGDPVHAARAIDVCEQAEARSHGLISARYTRADGTTLTPLEQAGLTAGFGTNVNVQRGARMLALSSGHARDASQVGACGSQSCTSNADGTAPPGFPQDSPSCPPSTVIHDDVALELHLRAPTNAVGFSVDHRFFTFEYPEYICDAYNDQVVVLVSPAPPGSISGNIAFDAQGNPVSVNVAYLEVCSGCVLGAADLEGTGFDTWNDAGGTGWLTSRAPVTPGAEFMLRFMIWDSGDQNYDSTVLIDRFTWLLDPVTVGTSPVAEPL